MHLVALLCRILKGSSAKGNEFSNGFQRLLLRKHAVKRYKMQ